MFVRANRYAMRINDVGNQVVDSVKVPPLGLSSHPRMRSRKNTRKMIAGSPLITTYAETHHSNRSVAEPKRADHAKT